MKRLPESELELMLIIWEASEPISRNTIQEKIEKSRHLADTTVLSFLSRLESKGFITVEKRGKSNYYQALIPQEVYIKSESDTLLERFFGNSIKNLVAHFSEGDQIDPKQLEELKAYIDQEISKEQKK